MHCIDIDIQSSDIISLGDWCLENMKYWEFGTNEDDILLRYFNISSTHWTMQRYRYMGLSRLTISYLSIRIRDINDAVAFKLRWM